MGNNDKPNGGQKLHKTPPCYFFMAFLKWIPVLFIMSIICWSYYAYVVQLCVCEKSQKTFTMKCVLMNFNFRFHYKHCREDTFYNFLSCFPHAFLVGLFQDCFYKSRGSSFEGKKSTNNKLFECITSLTIFQELITGSLL